MSEAFLPRGPVLMTSSRKKEKIPTGSVITRDPFPKSKKIYVDGEIHDIKVAMREVETDDPTSDAPGADKFKITLYDTSGPYTDPDVDINVHRGLPPLREKWIRDRGDVSRTFTISPLNSQEKG